MNKSSNTKVLRKQKQNLNTKHIQNNTQKDEILRQLKIKLLKKIYFDLFTSMPDKFKSNNLTFETFAFEFAEEILEHSIDDPKASTYLGMLSKASNLIDNKYTLKYKGISPLELKKKKLKERENDEWAVVSKYQSELYKDEEQQKLIDIAQSMKEYYNDLKFQEEYCKHSEDEAIKMKQKIKESIVFEEKQKTLKEKKENDKKIQKLIANEKLLEAQTKHNIKNVIDKQRIKEKMIKEILEENKKLSKNNTNTVKMKIDNFTKIQNNDMNLLSTIPRNNFNFNSTSFSNEDISTMVDKIMKQKEQMNTYNLITSNDIKEPQMYKLENIDDEMESKVDKIIKDKIKDINYDKYSEILFKLKAKEEEFK